MLRKIIFIALLSIFILSCSQNNDTELNKLKAQVAELENQKLQQEFIDLKKQKTIQKSDKNTKEEPKSSPPKNMPINTEGIIYSDTKYAPFNRYIDIKNLRLLVLDGVSDEIVIKISKTYENMFQDNGSIDQSKRDTLLNTLKNNYVFQRVGGANPDAYGGEPPCCPDYAHHIDPENINDFAHNASDYIWEKNPEESERQTIEVIEHLLHTITDQGFRHAFPETWEWNNSNSLLNMAMNQAIEKKIYNIESYKFIKNIDPVGYRKTIATEYAFWMILSAWDMFETANIRANDEWNLDSSEDLKNKLQLSWKLYEETVLPVLSVPNKSFIKELYTETQTSDSKAKSDSNNQISFSLNEDIKNIKLESGKIKFLPRIHNVPSDKAKIVVDSIEKAIKWLPLPSGIIGNREGLLILQLYSHEKSNLKQVAEERCSSYHDETNQQCIDMLIEMMHGAGIGMAKLSNNPLIFEIIGGDSYWNPGPSENVFMISTHEWMHVYQYSHTLDLPGTTNENQIQSQGPIWLSEGMADYTGYKLSDKHGKVSYEKFVKNLINIVSDITTANNILSNFETPKQQVDWEESNSSIPLAQIGQLASIYLAVTRGEEKIYQGYYKHLNKLGYEKSFEQNFGVTPSEFYKEFDDFLNKSDEAKQNILKVN